MSRLKLAYCTLIALGGIGGGYNGSMKGAAGAVLRYVADEGYEPGTMAPIYLLKRYIPYESSPENYFCEYDNTVCTISLYSSSSVKTSWPFFPPQYFGYVYASEAYIVDDDGTYVEQ